MSAKSQMTDGAHDALNRMRRAYERGTGCHLTAEMISSLGLTFLAEVWSEEDPRSTHETKKPGATGLPQIGHKSGCVTINCPGCGTDFYSEDRSPRR